MENNPFIRAITILEQSGARYVAVGGFAVVLHGINRFTPDLNVVVDFSENAPQKVVQGLSTFGFQLDRPEEAEQFSDPQSRDAMFDNGKRYSLSFQDPEAPTFRVDLFLSHPIDFEDLFRQSSEFICTDGKGRVCSREHLLELKKIANRGQDRTDIESLGIIEEFSACLAGQESDEEVIARLSDQYARERIQDLLEFARMEPDEKLEWLCHMLTHLGKFCVI